MSAQGRGPTVPPFIYKLIMDHDRRIKALESSPLPWTFEAYIDETPVTVSPFSPEERVRVGMVAITEPLGTSKRRLR